MLVDHQLLLAALPSGLVCLCAQGVAHVGCIGCLRAAHGESLVEIARLVAQDLDLILQNLDLFLEFGNLLRAGLDQTDMAVAVRLDVLVELHQIAVARGDLVVLLGELADGLVFQPQIFEGFAGIAGGLGGLAGLDFALQGLFGDFLVQGMLLAGEAADFALCGLDVGEHAIQGLGTTLAGDFFSEEAVDVHVDLVVEFFEMLLFLFLVHAMALDFELQGCDLRLHCAECGDQGVDLELALAHLLLDLIALLCDAQQLLVGLSDFACGLFDVAVELNALLNVDVGLFLCELELALDVLGDALAGLECIALVLEIELQVDALFLELLASRGLGLELGLCDPEVSEQLLHVIVEHLLCALDDIALLADALGLCFSLCKQLTVLDFPGFELLLVARESSDPAQSCFLFLEQCVADCLVAVDHITEIMNVPIQSLYLWFLQFLVCLSNLRQFIRQFSNLST
eukprot:comp20079_c0_seq1/m.39482 comp20079_c0_seq1/g.39482  ORF comp20079_c0_seq1/g.39482 comp20079_c0_seq1/m.39482 type:complete len:457 (-) comp20079_c0_seq1:421-1791(-)